MRISIQDSSIVSLLSQKQILGLLRQGQISQAVKYLDSLSWDSQSVLLWELRVRTLVENHQYTKALSTVDAALKMGISSDQLLLEKILALILKGGRTPELIRRLPFFTAHQPVQTALKLASEFYRRHHLKEAVDLLHEARCQHPQDPRLVSRFTIYNQSLFMGIYYRTYGFVIMAFQIMTTLAVLSLAILYLEQSLDSAITLISTLLTIIALLPVSILNLRMIFERILGSENCYSEFYPGFIKVLHHGKVFRMSCEASESHLYQDDNDYSYISWIRHLPFVPNFTYLRSRNLESDNPIVLPLYGVADSSRVLHHFKGRPLPALNMVGVRLAQLETYCLENSWMSQVGICLGALGLSFSALMILAPKVLERLYLFIILNSERPWFSYLSPSREFVLVSDIDFYILPEFLPALIICLSSLLLLLSKPLARTLMRALLSLPGLATLVKMPLVRPGILFLAFFSFYPHYSAYGFWAIPVLCLCALFYFIFVKTRYSKEEKQAVAAGSAVWKNPLYASRYQRYFELEKIDLISKGQGYGKPIKTLFLSKTHIIIPQCFLSLTLRFLVTERCDLSQVKILETSNFLNLGVSTQVEMGRVSFKVQLEPEQVRAQLERAGFTVDPQIKEKKGLLQNTMIRLIVFPVLYLIGALFLLPTFENLIVYPILVLALGTLLGFAWQKPWWPIFLVFCGWQVFVLAPDTHHPQFKTLELTNFQEFKKRRAAFTLEVNNPVFTLLDSPLRVEIQEPPQTYGNYEAYLLSHQDQEFRSAPPFIFVKHPREDILSIISWHLVQKQRLLDGNRYPNALSEYCSKKGLGVISSRLRGLSCGIHIRLQGTASDFVEDLLKFAPPSVLSKIPEKTLIASLRNQPRLLSLFPVAIQTHPTIRPWVQFLVLLALRENPHFLSSFSGADFIDSDFLRTFLRIYIRHYPDLKDLGACLEFPGVMEILGSREFLTELGTINPRIFERLPFAGKAGKVPLLFATTQADSTSSAISQSIESKILSCLKAPNSIKNCRNNLSQGKWAKDFPPIKPLTLALSKVGAFGFKAKRRSANLDPRIQNSSYALRRALEAIERQFQKPLSQLDLGKPFAAFLVHLDPGYLDRHGFPYRNDPEIEKLRSQ